ncbi:MAG TPA: response regulator [Polyangiaceae bacterium]|jgi:two-component system chemotaxis sensor kinase CheA|nr:response regulator [Polyangiaceae bacterium]
MADPYRYFRIEAGEILGQLQKGLLELERGAPSAQATVAALLRQAHTLKGAARVVKQLAIADLAHAIEDIFVPIRDAGGQIEASAVSRALVHLDAMRAALGALDAPVAPTGPEKKPEKHAHPKSEELWTAKPNAQDLDLLMDGLGEVSGQLGVIRRARRLLERAKSAADLLVGRVALRRERADHGESANLRALAEELQTTLENAERVLVSGTEQASRELGQARDAAERLRLVPVESIWDSLERTARDAAVSLEKNVRFVAQGGEVRLDADVLGLCQRALIQAVRNAVAHGIEQPRARAALGKPPNGTVTVSVRLHDREAVFSCQDDGHGLDLEAVRRSAEQHGLSAAEARRMSADEIVELLLRGGISTAHAVTSVSGRGIGLDLVRETAERLGGKVRLESAVGRGTTLSLAVPASLSALSALLVEVSGQIVALPQSSIEGTARKRADEISHSADGETIAVAGKLIPFVPLARLLGSSEIDDERKQNRSAIFVSAEARTVALEVDRLLGVEIIVARELPELSLLSAMVSGASLDADGNPRLVLSPVGVVRAASGLTAAPRLPASRVAPILVIDDSLTTRMLEQSILESAGYEVELATSGEEGLDKAKRRKYALFLVDVEMPGIDGFTFIERVRQDPALRDTPAILVTSRASAADRERGRAVGAVAHIEKKEFNQSDLLSRIKKLVS